MFYQTSKDLISSKSTLINRFINSRKSNIHVDALSEVSYIQPNMDGIIYLNWSNDCRFFAIGSQYGNYDIINVSTENSVYEYPMSNSLARVHDIRFLYNCENSKIIYSDKNMVKIFPLEYPNFRENIIKDLKFGHNIITLSHHHPDLFIFHLSDNHFAYFDYRYQHNINVDSEQTVTSFIYPVQHCAACPTRPYEIMTCFQHQTLAFYDLRMLKMGDVITYTSKGLIGFMDPFSPDNSPVIMSIDYRYYRILSFCEDGSELICTEYWGNTVIQSYDPSPEVPFKSKPIIEPRFYSRSSYSDNDFKFDRKYYFSQNLLINKLDKNIAERTVSFLSNTVSPHDPPNSIGFINFRTKLSRKIDDCIYSFIPKYRNIFPVPKQIGHANQSIYWGINNVIFSNKKNNELNIWNRSEEKYIKTIKISDNYNITHVSKAPYSPIFATVCDGADIRLFASTSLNCLIK